MYLWWICVCLFVAFASSQEYEYYDEEEIPTETSSGGSDEYYYYDEPEQDSDNRRNVEENAYVPPVRDEPGVNLPGFRKNIRGLSSSLVSPIVNEDYLNNTMENYGCILREDYGLKGTRLTKEDMEKILLEQDPNIEVEEAVNVALEGNIAFAVDHTAEAAKSVDKRMSYREREMQKFEERRAERARKARATPMFLYGPPCEDQVCGACKTVVEIFANNVVKAINDPNVQYLIDILDEDFCRQRELTQRYKAPVEDMCYTLLSNQGYKEALLGPFEATEVWAQVASPANLFQHKKKVCMDVGACTRSDFEIQTVPYYKEQEFWNETCYVCQEAVKDLETTVCLEKGVTEKRATELTGKTCDKLGLAKRPEGVCKNMIKGKLWDDISWMVKVHAEEVNRATLGEVIFTDQVCEEIKYCEKWFDPVERKKKEMEESFEAVYS